MVNRLFAYLVEACVLGQVWDVAVHLAINLDILHHVAAISFQSAVEVVQIVDAAHLACCGIEELGRNGLGEWVALLAVHLVARYEVITFLGYHLVETWYLVWRILQVGIHGDDHVALCLLESTVEGWALCHSCGGT
mgnify:CR=1 FL=1